VRTGQGADQADINPGVVWPVAPPAHLVEPHSPAGELFGERFKAFGGPELVGREGEQSSTGRSWMPDGYPRLPQADNTA
jgi:hypothetical protein